MVTTYQYPQYLYALRTGEATKNPASGSWETGANAWELKGICREETNGKGHVIHTSGGDSIVFSSLIQIPAETGRINEGTEIIVARDEVLPDSLLSGDFVKHAKITGLIIAQGACLKYDFGRLHSRLWI
jgi:hypothetical protein